MDNIEALLGDGLSSDVLAWVRKNFSDFFEHPLIAHNEPALATAKIIFPGAFHATFVGDSNKKEDGIGLSALDDYDPQIRRLFLDALSRAPDDNCGYIREYIQEYSQRAQPALSAA